ncbi:VKGC carboxylase, partial [Bombycilla garrulus]|nr:VKGC carboxylase [Bombycilla garrulus]
LGEPPPAGEPLDPLVSLFLRRERRQQRRERDSSPGQRLQRFVRRKFFLFRRSALMTLLALRNLALGRPSPERLAQEVAFASWRGEEEEARPEADGGAPRGPEL